MRYSASPCISRRIACAFYRLTGPAGITNTVMREGNSASETDFAKPLPPPCGNAPP